VTEIDKNYYRMPTILIDSFRAISISLTAGDEIPSKIRGTGSSLKRGELLSLIKKFPIIN
jgi:hypothetical protein